MFCNQSKKGKTIMTIAVMNKSEEPKQKNQDAEEQLRADAIAHPDPEKQESALYRLLAFDRAC